nr:equilibrative nucleotide transporter 3-like [Ipomoea batatas]
MTITIDESSRNTLRLEGKLSATIVCWILGLGSLLSWNTMLTIGDYYYEVFPLDLGTSGKGGLGSYIGICVVAASFGVADANVQGGMVGDLSFMCPGFMQHSSNGLRKGVILFLAISALIEFLCIVLYAFVFPKFPIVKYYRSKAAAEGLKTVLADLAAAGITTPTQIGDDANNQVGRLSKKELFIKNIDYALDLNLIYVLTLSIFPGFLYENTGTHNLGSWYAIVLIAMYNALDLIARYIPLIKKFELKSRKGLMVAILSRFLLIPCFYFTAKYGNQGWMIMLVSYLGLTNGYLTVCVLTIAPKGYNGPEANALGNILMLCLLIGMCFGVTLGCFTYTYSENSAMESVSSNSTTTTLEDHQQPPLLLAPNHHQQITGSEEHPGAEGNHHHHWIHKRLSTSDVNLSARLLLPKEEIRKYVLPLMDMESCRACENRDGLRVKIWDLDTESEHQLSLKQWKTGSFLLTSNWIIEFVKRRSLLQAG